MAEPAPVSRPPLAIRHVPLPTGWRTPFFAILAVLFSSLLLAACGDEPKPPDAFLEIRAGTVQVKAAPGAPYVPAADGQELAIFGARDVAFVAARQNDLEPVSVH